MKKKVLIYVLFIIVAVVVNLIFLIKKIDYHKTNIELATTEIKDYKEIENKTLETNNIKPDETNNEDNQTSEEIQIKEENKTELQDNTQIIKKETKINKEEAKTKEETNEQKTEQAIKSTYNQNAFNNTFLKNHPSYGEQYATLIISKIGVKAPIIFGADDETILRGVGHDSGSYFPGEGGTIVMCEHNYMNNFGRLGELKNGNIINIKTNYGDFYYRIYDKKIIAETEVDKLPIQKEEEILMLYTCYPLQGTGHTNQRLVVYGRMV